MFYYVMMLGICLVCIVGCTFFTGAALAGATYLNQKLFGDSDDPSAFDFERHDERQLQEFVLRCALIAAIPAAVALLIGFVLAGLFGYFRPHPSVLGFILVIFYAASAAAANVLVSKLDPKRAAVATGAMTLVFIILNWWFFLSNMPNLT